MANAKMITSNTHGDYFYIDNFDHEIQIEIAGQTYYGSFQTGHGFRHNDYSMPSNSVSAYDNGGVIECLDNCAGDYADFIEESGLEITKEEFDEKYDALIELRHEAQGLVDQLIAEAEEELEKDNSTYVKITPFETAGSWDYENGEEVSERRQCGVEYVEKFSLEFDADEAIEKERENGNCAHVCTKEEAYELSGNK